MLTTLDVMLARLWNVRDHFMIWWTSLGTLTGDGLLYLLAAGFALALGWTSHQAAQWQWGYLSVGPYLLIAVVALVLGRRARRREHLVRVILLGTVIVGVVFIPLGLETHWRQAQPEVGVIERSGALLSKGLDPYRAYQKNGQIVNEIKGLPAFESFFPYFPLMSVFGLPFADTKQSKGLTDARIIMTLMTLIASGWALVRLRLSRSQKLRVAQVLIALPTGALFLSTGGDDMPILALLLLGVAALQRRQSNLAGISLGLAAAMKLTAWPMAAGALLVAKPRGSQYVATIAVVGRSHRARDDRALRLQGTRGLHVERLRVPARTRWRDVARGQRAAGPYSHDLGPGPRAHPRARDVLDWRVLRDEVHAGALAPRTLATLRHLVRGLHRHDVRGFGDACGLRHLSAELRSLGGGHAGPESGDPSTRRAG